MTTSEDAIVEILREEEPEMTELSPGSNFHFIFNIDRSFSMRGPRMRLAKEALTIFIQSLPVGCRFSVYSFGSKFFWMEHWSDYSNVLAYNEDTIRFAINEI